MQNKKTEKHKGQQPLLNEFDEAQADDRPKGMPSLAELQTEVIRRGLPSSDGEYLYNSWLVSGFKTARGTKICSWKAAVRNWAVMGYFPSQKKSPIKFHDEERNRQAEIFRRMKNGSDAA